MKWEWLKGEKLMNPSFYYDHTVHSVVCIPKYITQGGNEYIWEWHEADDLIEGIWSSDSDSDSSFTKIIHLIVGIS